MGDMRRTQHGRYRCTKNCSVCARRYPHQNASAATTPVARAPSLPQHLVILKNLTSSLAVVAFSACLRKRALQSNFSNKGGVSFGRARSLLDDLIVSSPAGKTLADGFTQLALLIRHALNSPEINTNGCAYYRELLPIFTSYLVFPVPFFPHSSPISNAQSVWDLSS